MRDLRSALMEERAILAEGSVIERLSRGGVKLDEHVLASALVLDGRGREALRGIFDSYLEVAAETGLLFVVLAPTWRAGTWPCERAGLDMKDINTRCVSFIRDTIGRYQDLEGRVFAGGLVSCRGDAYDPGDFLPREAARAYHAPQIEALAGAGVDFVMASTFPSVEEAAGAAIAASEVGVPFVASYVARPGGCVLDGTPLCEAVDTIDDLAASPPIFHMCNCMHPANLARALGSDLNAPLRDSGRLVGLQGNASMLDPADLDGLSVLDSEDPVRWAGAMAALLTEYGIKLLGGCCGTDERHIRRLAEFLTQ